MAAGPVNAAETRPSPAADSVRDEIARVCGSAAFANAHRSSCLLRFTAEHALAGKGNTLKEYTVGVEVLGRPPTFDPRLDAIVRVEATRLRARLKEYYSGQGLQDAIAIEFPKGSYVPVFRWREPVSSVATDAAPQPSRIHRGWILLGLAAAAVLLILAAMAWRPRTGVQPPVLVRLTADAGLTSDPAISRDGRLVAYASDRTGEGKFDIWLQHASGGQALRLTQDPVGARQPDFSPDGSRIVFRSGRDGGGIYIMPSFGGHAELLAKGGRRPHYSPNGDLIAYHVAFLGEQRGVYVIPASGGAAVRIQPDFADARFPLWSPDGGRLLFLGRRRADEETDWWISPVGKGDAIRTGAVEMFRNTRLSGEGNPQVGPTPGSWVGDYVYFSSYFGSSMNCWRVPISPGNGRVSGPAQPVTFGAGQEVSPAAAALHGDRTRLVFAAVRDQVKLWKIELTPDGGAAGALAKLTSDPGSDYYPFLSRDGKILAFADTRAGMAGNVRLIDLTTDNQTAITDSPDDKGNVVADAWGGRVAFVVTQQGRSSLRIRNSAGGEERVLCAECGRPQDWTLSGDRLLVLSTGFPTRLLLWHIDSGQVSEVTSFPQPGLLNARIAPDGEWIALQARGKIYLTPVRPSVRWQDWIPVTSGSAIDRYPGWSSDPNTVYFLSNRDGVDCVWAQHLDSTTKHPSGQPFPVVHLHGSTTMSSTRYGIVFMAAAARRIVLNIREQTGNVWMTEMP